MEKKRFLETGQIVTTHGIAGAVKVRPWCDTPDFLTEFETLYFDHGKVPMQVENARVFKDMVLIKFAGVSDMTAAQKLRGRVIYADREDIILPEGSYFIQDLIGLSVVDADQPAHCYGRLTEVIQPGANDVYTVRTPEGKDVLIPVIPDVVIRTDLAEGKLYIRPLKGLFDDAD
ncbi:MAG TPA: ribosome maturation factor RimM [Firmicutes bacterium]|nr:ribosome maturation factor RimM [Bacillota bacterium]